MSGPLRILEIVSGAEINGAVVHSALLCRELALRGNAVTLLCRQNAKVVGLVADAGVDVARSDMHRLPFDEVQRIGAFACERGIQVIHTHMTRAHNFGVVLSRVAKIPVVATAHSHIIQPLTFMFNTHVIAVSEATRRFQVSRNLVRNANITTVHGFADYHRYADTPDSAGAAVRRSLGISGTTPLIGIIGDVIPRKGHLYLFQALAKIVHDRPDARLLVVGEPKRKMGVQYDIRIREEARRLGIEPNIVWAGHRADVADILSALDVYVLASLDEMFPVAVLEAMAARKPVVATSVGGVAECLTDGLNALLVPSADPAKLAAALIRVLDDRQLADRLAGAAQERVRQQFSAASQAPRIEAVLRAVAARGASTRRTGAA